MATNESIQLPPRATDETGNRYGILTVREYLGKTRSGDSLWMCDCDCGTPVKVARGDLRKKYGGTKSCGCGRKSQGGGHGTTEYQSWKDMKQRCYNANCAGYRLYGERGITICDRWRRSFVNFLADMGKKPFPEASIERVDNDGNYEPGNCKWASTEEQGQNTSRTRRITFNGETMGLRAWSRRVGIQHRTLSMRLKRGWTIEEALTTPASQQHIPPKQVKP